jgi:hypothetical protein
MGVGSLRGSLAKLVAMGRAGASSASAEDGARTGVCSPVCAHATMSHEPQTIKPMRDLDFTDHSCPNLNLIGAAPA